MKRSLQTTKDVCEWSLATQGSTTQMNESPHLDLAPTSPWQHRLNNSNERVTSPGLGSNIALATQGSTTQMNESPHLDLAPTSPWQHRAQQLKCNTGLNNSNERVTSPGLRHRLGNTGLNSSNERVTSPGLGSNIALATQGSTAQMNESPHLDLAPTSPWQHRAQQLK